MTDADRLDRLESIEAIRQLVARYALATDSRDLDTLVKLFVDDVHVGAELGESPLGLPPANWPEHHTGTGELPEAWETWRDFWGP